MTEEQKARLLIETQETAARLNKLNSFMASAAFPQLHRRDKDLLYAQQRAMSEYVQILGKRLERARQRFKHAGFTAAAALIEGHAAQLYSVYCEAVGGVAFNGDSLPSWTEFDADPNKRLQADAWRSVAKQSLNLD